MNSEASTRRRAKKHPARHPKPRASANRRSGRRRNALFPIVGIGASAGGLEAFTQLLKSLPLDTGMGFVLVQHLDPDHESALTQILSRATKLPVSEITDHQTVEPNHVYVIPRDTSLGIVRGVLKLGLRQKTRLPHRPIDAFFESLAQDQGERAIGVVLSGTASDGTLGLESIKAAGGIAFAQDDSAKHDSMPRSAVAAGCVDLVLSPSGIAVELARIAKHPYIAGHSLALSIRAEVDRAEATAHQDDLAPLPSGGRGNLRSGGKQARAEAKGDPTGADDGYKKILLLLRNHSGVDFSLYKSNTIQRRINRRVILTKQDTLTEYAGFLRSKSGELDALYSDVLISVTSFFRNPEMFDALKHRVLPELLKQRDDEPLRCWVLGCSTGQEAYSIAMSFIETAEQAPHVRNLQIFATDLNDALLDKARHGLYAKSVADEVAPERLRRFFVEEQGGYRVSKKLRELVVFARQNLISDPPFSRMDLISCRNLLIYLEPSLQKKALPTFHYALKPSGFLLLGASESIGGFTDLFEPVDKKHKIYSRKPVPTMLFHLPVRRTRGHQPPTGRRPLLPLPQAGKPEPPDGLSGELNAQREADRITINRFGPSGVLINAEMQILQFRGPTGAYLEPPAGKASFDVLKMAREGLMLPLRATIDRAGKENRIARKANVVIGQNGATRTVHLEVIPLKNVRERCFLILFEDAGKPGRTGGRAPDGAQGMPRPSGKRQEPNRVAELQSALAETREYLQSLQEQHEAANEELQASSEEVQSANEELQSINEELETSKEELESSNEELITVNEEMSHRNIELNRLNNDLINFQASVHLAIISLAHDLTIRHFSPQAEKQFELLATDVGRRIGHIRHNLSRTTGATAADSATPADLESMAAEVIASTREQEFELQDKTGHWYSLRVRPYLTVDNKSDGAVLVLLDIDALKRNEASLISARDQFQHILATVHEPLLVLGQNLCVEYANEAFYDRYAGAPAETIGKSIYEAGNHEWNIPRLRELLEHVLPGRTSVERFLMQYISPTNGTRSLLINARRIADPSPAFERTLLMIEDVTERSQARIASERLAAIVKSTNDAIISTDRDGLVTSWNEGAHALFGWSADEVDGKALALLIPPSGTVEEPSALGRILVGESVVNLETVRQHKDGRLVEILLTSSPLKDEAGRVIGMTQIAHDITMRKRHEDSLRKQAQQFETLLFATPFGVYVVDADFRICHVNPNTLQIFGDMDVIGRDFDEVIRVLWPKSSADDIVARFRHTLDTGEPYITREYIEERLDRGVTERYEWQISRIPLPDDRHGVVCFFRDISAEVLQRDALRDSRRRLTEESHRKDEFLAMLSHELRNPLAAIRSAEYLLRMHGRGQENPTQRKAREIIERQVTVLTKMVGDLLEVSRIISGRVHLDRQVTDINQIALHAVEATRPLFERRRQTLLPSLRDEPLWSDVDVTRIEEVLVNLLTNAAKFTDEGGRIEIRSELSRERDRVRVSVRDDGIGIDADLLPRIFELFVQGDRSLERSAGGLGIGLSLARRLVELHGGTIEVHSPPVDVPESRGSEFIVQLPAAAPPAVSRSVVSGAGSGRVRKEKVLIVEDNDDQASMLVDILQQSGHGVRSVNNGRDALDVALTWRPDIVLLDIGLPGLDGYQVARSLRSHPELRAMMLIALTGYTDERAVAAARDAGFDAHLAKPLDFAELESLIDKHGQSGSRD